MKERAAEAGQRLCRGTWFGLEAYGRWLGGDSHADRSGTVRIGVILRRLGASLFAVIFYGSILQRAPQLIYAVPPAWLWAAWQVSDSSATPPPRGAAPDSDVDAAHRRAKARGVYDPNGVMCTYHPPRVEVTADAHGHSNDQTGRTP